MSILELLAAGRDGDPVLQAPGREPLSYGGLRQQVEEAMEALRRFGIRPGHRVAMVMPNGPEMAAAFLAVAGTATAAPLNPAYRGAELDYYLGDLGACALLVEAGGSAAARSRGVPIIELQPRGDQAGGFELSGQGVAAAPAGPAEVALVLHTSGTTSRPKRVPLSHDNLVASARAVAATLALSPDDRALHIMPLFHIHGLVAGLLAPLATGGSLFVPGSFDALRFFRWMDEAWPTWYTGVPTMHQAILSRAPRNREVLERIGLRFVRSSSAPLAPAVLRALEETFGAPVVEAYGMTEAAHQMTSNPLVGRVPGSVGLPAGPEVTVLDAAGQPVPRGATGEVCIRGPSVTRGYEGDAAANAAAFTGDWFRTGDQGRFDDDGYLYLTGRLKEIINRGGEKIAPREVDEVLLAHPSVAQAITFALPHDRLGEEVAAAIVLRPGMTAGEEELRAFTAERLADFKVPRRIVFVAEIPTGPTGKLQRVGLAGRLGLA
jgi:acyl-CoA synthetase (AMP-forming)/AMP-acid ligase II